MFFSTLFEEQRKYKMLKWKQYAITTNNTTEYMLTDTIKLKLEKQI